MIAKNKYLLPKRTKWTHKEYIDLSTYSTVYVPLNKTIKRIAQGIFGSGFVFFYIPAINPLTMGWLANKFLERYG